MQAGFLSFVAGLLSKEAPAEKVSLGKSSQSIALLQAAVNSDPNPSKGGGDITIIGDSALLPDVGPSGTLADIEESVPSSDQISIYVVREGDSLSQIAQMFNVSVNTIVWANDLKRGSLITPGQTLIILPVTGVRHKVAKGETLAGIVKKYKGDMEEVLAYNDLPEGAALSVGDVVVIPDGVIATPVFSTTQVAKGTGGPTYAGYYLKPVNGVRTQGLHGYNGVDLGAPVSTAIVASAAGTVLISKDYGWNGGYGNYIVISHDNGTQTLYAHNSSNIVYQGQMVVQGQVIGYVGTTGRSTGPHLHFEIRGAKNPF